MDYNEIRESVTLYLPVFERGALLFLGDGHAVQGDGELTGDALETSMSIEFSVAVIPRIGTFRPRLGAPRAENDEFLMAIGISGDLADALRASTTEMSSWLKTDYGLDDHEVAAVRNGAPLRCSRLEKARRNECPRSCMRPSPSSRTVDEASRSK